MTTKPQQNILKKNRNEILWNLINSGLAGGLVFVGVFASGNITLNGVIAGFSAAAIVAITKFKDYWKSEQSQYKCVLFNFI